MPGNQSPLQDPEAFSQLYARTHLIIFRFVFGLQGGPAQEVEDLTCETYLRAWRGRNGFKGDDRDALRWLFTIARHLVIDAHRRKKSRIDETNELLDDALLDKYFIIHEEQPEELATRREQFIHLWTLLQSLPFEKREMIVLRFILGWQVKQIAEYLHMEENTVSVNIRRILEGLRRNWSLDEHK
jgi:RNA polymerase sigma-70 factor, ECF subfamily